MAFHTVAYRRCESREVRTLGRMAIARLLHRSYTTNDQMLV